LVEIWFYGNKILIWLKLLGKIRGSCYNSNINKPRAKYRSFPENVCLAGKTVVKLHLYPVGEG
jgi:hypothetical protein